jgi:hyperosmotically inducible protein
LITLASLVGLLALTASCASTYSATKEAASDAWITSKVSTRLAADPEVTSAEVDVDTTDGVVSLRGIVESRNESHAAASVAANTRGVKRVDNQLEIGDPTVQEKIDDTWVATKIETKLTSDPEVNPFNVDVDVNAGVVTLSGTVATLRDSREAAELAMGTQGVSRVDNQLTVRGSK